MLTELPDKVRQVIELPQNGNAKRIQDEWDKWAEYKEDIEQLRAAVEKAKEQNDKDSYKKAVRALNSELMVAFSDMARVRHETAVAKIPSVIAHLQDAVDSSNKVVTFAHHHDVVTAIKEHFAEEAVVVDGRVSQKKRQERIDEFQSNEKCKLFIGSITAAGVGITLTAASHVVFAELDWVPGNVSQAEDRLHRIGQAESVLVQHLVFADSLDAYMANMIVDKQEVIDKALDEKAKAPQLPEQKVVTDANGGRKTAGKRGDLKDFYGAGKHNDDDYKKDLKEISYVQYRAIQTCLRLLAARCDGAVTWDGAGFNKFDTNFGKSLAAQESWSTKQTKAAKKVVNKYRGQLPEHLLTKCGIVKGEKKKKRSA